MQWIIELFAKSPRFSVYQAQVDDVLNNLERNPTLSIEICKALIEGVCKTILTDKGNRIPEQFPKLVIETLNSLNINNHPDYEHINQLFSRLNGVIQYIGEIRNSVGCYASHGQDIEHKKPTKDLALFVSHTTNSVLGFILHLYIGADLIQPLNKLILIQRDW